MANPQCSALVMTVSLGWFDRTSGNSAIYPPTPKTLPRRKHEVDRITRCGDMAIRNSAYHLWCVCDTNLGEKGGFIGAIQNSSIVPFKRTSIVSYMLSIVTIALSLTTLPQFAIECLRRSNQQGCSVWVKILVCYPFSRSVMSRSTGGYIVWRIMKFF